MKEDLRLRRWKFLSLERIKNQKYNSYKCFKISRMIEFEYYKLEIE